MDLIPLNCRLHKAAYVSCMSLRTKKTSYQTYCNKQIHVYCSPAVQRQRIAWFICMCVELYDCEAIMIKFWHKDSITLRTLLLGPYQNFPFIRTFLKFVLNWKKTFFLLLCVILVSFFEGSRRRIRFFFKFKRRYFLRSLSIKMLWFSWNADRYAKIWRKDF